MTKDILSRLRPELTKLQAYSVPDATGLVKLDAMENPFTWPVAMRTKWLEQLSHAQVNRYPEPNPEGLKQKLKHQFGPHDASDILLGNGSDELIQLLVLAVAKPGACILTVSPSFSMYRMIAEMIGVDCHVVALDENHELDKAAMLTAIEKYDPALIFLAYPNNPTGNSWNRGDIQAIMDNSKGIVVIDEAYGPFAADTIFMREQSKNYDVIIGMYHDQVLTPLKSLFGFNAINITLGLPFVRVSPDHGPNSSMLGKNLSDPKSLIEALKFLDT